MKTLVKGVLLLAAVGLSSSSLFAQGSFVLRVRQGTELITVPSGGTVTIASPAVGTPVDFTVSVTYRGTGVAEATNFDVTGSSAFRQITTPVLPQVIASGADVRSDIRFTPTTSARTLGQVLISLRETIPPTTATGQPTVVLTQVELTLIGTAPEVRFAYALQPDNNVLAIASGGTLEFPPTTLNSTATSSFVIINRGSGPAQVDSISIDGEGFQIAGLPLLPGTLGPGETIGVTLRFVPRRIQRYTGTLTVRALNQTSTFTLEGSGVGSLFSYELLGDGGSVTPFSPDGTLTLPETALGSRSQLSIRVRNTGNAEGQISGISVVGSAFTVTDFPPPPIVLAPNGALIFTLNFAPVDAGRNQGRLRIGSDSFELAGNGLGAQLNFSYTTGSTVTNIFPGANIVLPPVAVGQSAATNFTLRNDGNRPTTVTSVSIGGGSSPFTLVNPPAFPLVIEGGSSVTMGIRFAPLVSGANSDVLRVDSSTFNLIGTGLQPPPLPSYQFSGASGQVQPLAQPQIGLALASAYPLGLRGTLVLTTDSDTFASDPAVQFSTGGRTVNFSIPAGSTQAVFANGSNQIRLQTGTVAGNITLTPTFVADGGVDRTPNPAPSLTLTVPSVAPRVLDVRLTGATGTAFNIVITGFATGRTLQRLDFTFAPAEGATLNNPTARFNIEQQAALWYRSPESQSAGGLFVATVPFVLTGPADTILTNSIQSVSVTATNDRGTSEAVVLNFR